MNAADIAKIAGASKVKLNARTGNVAIIRGNIVISPATNAIKVSNIASHLDKFMEEFEKKKESTKRIKTRLMEAYPYLVKRNFSFLDKVKKYKEKSKN